MSTYSSTRPGDFYKRSRSFAVDPDTDIAATRARLDRLAHLMDSAVRVPGTSVRIGADAMLNLIPGVGTLVAKGLSSYLIYEAGQLGVSKLTMLRLIGNVVVDFLISAVPVVGWFGDVFYRANTKNIALLKAHLDQKSGIINGAPISQGPL